MHTARLENIFLASELLFLKTRLHYFHPSGAVVVTAEFVAAFGVIRAAHILHLRLICNVMRAPIPSFFDTTPMGRIQNRFSKDIDAIDEDIPDTFGGFLYCFLDVVTALFVVTYIFPMILAILPPLMVAYALIQVFVR